MRCCGFFFFSSRRRHTRSLCDWSSDVCSSDLQLEEYVTSAVPMVRTEPTADDSLAAIFERSKFGMAMAAMIKMIATTISNSIREKPFCFFMRLNLLGSFCVAKHMVLEGKGRATS